MRRDDVRRPDRWRNKVVHHYYKCATAKRFKTCKKKTVRKEWLEDLVVAETMKLIQDDAVIDAIVAEVMELHPTASTLPSLIFIGISTFSPLWAAIAPFLKIISSVSI